MPRACEGFPGKPLTVEQFERLPDDGHRLELVRGRVVRESLAGFEHGRMAARIAHYLEEYVKGRRLGIVCGAETGFLLSTEPATVRGPDAAFVRADRVPAERVRGYFPGAPDLAAEILSPSSTAGEVRAKVRDYLEAGTRVVWVVDPEARTVAVHRARSGARILGESDELDGGDVLPGFRLPLAQLFAE